MSDKPEILFLSHRIPYPPDKGDKIRSWRLFRHLTERYSVHLACFVDDPQDFAHTAYLSSLCASAVFCPLQPALSKLRSVTGLLTGEALSERYFYDSAMLRAVNAARHRPLAAEIAFSSTMAQYIATPISGRVRIIDFCDADSEKWRQYACEAPPLLSWVYEREAKALARTEVNVANWADASFAITPDEAAIFNQRGNINKPVDWWSNGVDTAYFDPELRLLHNSVAADLVFTGAMDYRANIDAVMYFVSDVWPRIRAITPYATFAVVGAKPAKQVRALDGINGVTVTGRVDDVRPWISQAQLVVAPMRVARGVQNKVLEAMAMAKPVVATREAAVGIIADAHDAMCITQGADEMAAAIVRLLNEPSARERLGMRARAAVMTHYDWNKQLRRFDALAMPAIFGQTSSSDVQSSKLASSY